jgi:hypothetical protein
MFKVEYIPTGSGMTGSSNNNVQSKVFSRQHGDRIVK